MEQQRDCPIPQTHDRLSEVHHFLHEVIDNYHNPDEVRWSLNAFFQAGRNVTFVLQNELGHDAGFAAWYPQKQKEMARDPLFNLLNEKRVYVVHKGNLPVHSKARGMMRDGAGTVKEFGEIPMSADLQTAQLMVWLRSHLPANTPPDQEIGIQRLWRLEEFPDREVAHLCGDAYKAVGALVVEVHRRFGYRLDIEPNCIHHFDEITTNWESQLTAEGRDWYRRALQELRKRSS